MASLVADYGASSGEESDDSEANQPESCVKAEGVKKNDQSSKSEVTRVCNFFSAADAEDSDSDNDDVDGGHNHGHRKTSQDAREATKHNRLPNPLAGKLPTPLIALHKRAEVENSVFSSSYQKAEDAKNFALEQHVKMTSTEIQAKSKDGKRICWNFRKGKCRFGQKCKYSHGQDIPSEAVVELEEGVDQQTESESEFHFQSQGQYGPGPDSSQYQADEQDDDSYMAEAKRKKRVGMGKALVPPKRAMKSLQHQREQERPWTVPK